MARELIMSWPVQEAKARFSEFLEKSLNEGPQIVTKRGVETAVLVPIEEWRRLQQRARPTLKELLLAPEPRFESGLPYPRRGRLRRRKAVVFE
jgi:antitoxin Phd